MRNAECKLQNPKSRGVSLIAAIFIIVVLAFMGVMFLSMISTSTLTSVNDMQSAQALSVAEGGMEYILGNRTFPNYSMGGATMNLGAGNFMVATPTYLTADPGAAGTTITVQSTAIFPNAGRIIIDSELITYTGKNATQFSPAARGVGGTQATTHAAGNAVYPVTTVTDNPLLIGSATINVTSNVGFRIPGTIIIDTEYIFCATVNGTTQFTNCTRSYKSSPGSAHPNLSGVFQYYLASTGTVGNARRVVTHNVQHILSGAIMAYAKLNGNGTPYYRRWNGTSWGAEMTATPVSANIQYVMLKFARTRDEAVLGTLSSNGDIRVQVWNGAAWGATLLLANVGTTDDNYRGFDIEYETNGDRAIVVYNDGTADPDYRIWDGAGWSGAVNINIPTTGSPNWIELARNPQAGSNEIAMILLDSNSHVYGMRWTGVWNSMGAAAWDTAATTATYKAVHVAYEQQSGRALFVWGTRTSTNQNRYIAYRIWDGTTLGAVTNQAIANIGNHTARWVRLAPDPFSNKIMLGIQDSGTDLITSLWNGAAWDPNGTQHDNSLEDNSRNFDLVYETAAANAGSVWLLWGNGSRLSRRQWDGAAWGGIATTGDDTSFIQMAAHPMSGAVFSGIYESATSGTQDIWESHLTSGGSVWSAKFTVWGGPTVAFPVMERLSLAVERHYIPLVLFDWQENIN